MTRLNGCVSPLRGADQADHPARHVHHRPAAHARARRRADLVVRAAGDRSRGRDLAVLVARLGPRVGRLLGRRRVAHGQDRGPGRQRVLVHDLHRRQPVARDLQHRHVTVTGREQADHGRRCHVALGLGRRANHPLHPHLAQHRGARRRALDDRVGRELRPRLLGIADPAEPRQLRERQVDQRAATPGRAGVDAVRRGGHVPVLGHHDAAAPRGRLVARRPAEHLTRAGVAHPAVPVDLDRHHRRPDDRGRPLLRTGRLGRGGRGREHAENGRQAQGADHP